MKVVHAWLKDYVGESIPSAEKIEELLTFHAFEIEGRETVGGEEVIDVDVLPNRSSDCLSHLGIAREIAAITESQLATDPCMDSPDLPKTDQVTVAIANSKACGRFGAAVVSGIEIKESPDWLKSRLEALGQRSINNVVDATNYVMFALGQPLHAYDATKFPQTDGKWQFGVRFATAGEKITTLTGEEFECDERVQLIVDASSDTPAGVAGIKGGKYAEVDQSTTTIILEAANFDPVITRKSAAFLKLQTDASKRFENEVPPELIPHALKACAELITEIAGGVCEGYVDHNVLPVVSKAPTRVSVAQANSLLGIEISGADMVAILERLSIGAWLDGEELVTGAPWWRTDLNIPEDYIEEIGRVYGYEHVASVSPEVVPLKEMNIRHYYSEQVRETLMELGFSEVITSSFRKKDQVQLLNALASDKSYMRSSLIKNVTEALDMNAPHADLLGVTDTRIFELGTVFAAGEGRVEEHVSLCVGVRLKSSGYTGKEDKLLKTVLDAVNEKIGTTIDWQIEKGVAECNFTTVFESLAAPKAYEAVTVSEETQYQPFSVYPAMSRDIAMWVPMDTSAEVIEAVLNESAGDLRVRTTLFDEFEKDGQKSFAFRLVFQSKEKTLTDEEVTIHIDAVNKAVAENGWEVR